MDTEENVRRYWAFISYSHADKAWADWLHKSLENYPMPRDLVGKPTPVDAPVPKRFVPIFRDREELPTATDLGAVIEKALRHARYLVVLCSPRSAQSMWVNQEIEQYKKLHGEDRVLCMIVDGEPYASEGKPGFAPEDECFPKAVRYRMGDDGVLSDVRTEPIAADAREGKDGKEAAVIKLMAGLLGVGFDALKRREEAYQRRRLRRLQALSAVFAALFVAAVVAAVYAVKQKREVQRTLSRADLQLAIQARDEGNVPMQKAYLARSLRSDPDNKAAAMAAWSALAHAKEHLPVGPVLRHGEGVVDAVGSPDGKWVVTAAGSRLFLWSRPGNELEGEVDLDGSAVKTLAPGNDGSGVVVGTDAGGLHFRLFDKLEAAREAVMVDGFRVLAAEWRPDGEVLAVALNAKTKTTNEAGVVKGDDATWIELRAQDGRVLSRTWLEKCLARVLVWSPEGRSLAVAGASPQFYVLQGDVAEPSLQTGRGKLAVTGLLFESGERLRVMDYLEGWQDWDLETMEKTGKPKPVRPACARIAVSPDRRQFLGLNRGASAYVYEVKTSLIPTRPLTPAFTVSGGHYLDRDHVLLTSESGLAQVRRLRPGVPAVTVAHTRNDFSELVAVSPDENLIATCSTGGTLVRFYDAKTLERRGRPVRFPVKVHEMDFMADGERLVGLGWDGHLHLLWAGDGRKRVKGSTQIVPAVEDEFRRLSGTCFSRQAGRLAVLGDEGVIVVDTEQDEVLGVIGEKVEKEGFGWSPDGQILAVATAEEGVRFYGTDAAPVEGSVTIPLNSPGIRLAWSPDGARLAVDGSAGQVQVFEVGSGKAVGVPLEPGGFCEQLEWTADGTWVLTSNSSNEVRLWDPESGLAVASFPRVGALHGCHFMSDGRALLSVENKLGLLPMPELTPPPGWLPRYLEVSGGAKLSSSKGESLLDPDAWMEPDAAPGPGDDSVWAELHRWLTAGEERPAAFGATMTESEAVEVMAWDRVWSEVVAMQREMGRLFRTGQDADIEKALGLLDRAIELDADWISLHEAKVTVGESFQAPALALDGYIGIFESSEATLPQVLESKVIAAALCWKVDPPNLAYAEELLAEVLAEDPGNEIALDLKSQLEKAREADSGE